MKSLIVRASNKYIFRLGRALGSLVNKTDKGRWAKVAKEVPPWDSRNRVIATLIPPGMSVLDIGAGAQTLRQHIRNLRLYTPCDLFPTTPDTQICDFNNGVYPQGLPLHDFAVCSGIFEYIREPGPFFSFLRKSATRIIFTYNVRLPDESKVDRLAKGWINHFTREELTRLLTENGFKVVQEIKSNKDCPGETVFVLQV